MKFPLIKYAFGYGEAFLVNLVVGAWALIHPYSLFYLLTPPPYEHELNSAMMMEAAGRLFGLVYLGLFVLEFYIMALQRNASAMRTTLLTFAIGDVIHVAWTIYLYAHGGLWWQWIGNLLPTLSLNAIRLFCLFSNQSAKETELQKPITNDIVMAEA
ncbi:hypothetical protein AKO1_006226 [Acrasis kona]|uniref:Uncharacterized protein n=1 Tax=Acrasis kona TaxID=1008807 RepID=A0AAW2YI18_9EUKA